MANDLKICRNASTLVATVGVIALSFAMASCRANLQANKASKVGVDGKVHVDAGSITSVHDVTIVVDENVLYNGQLQIDNPDPTRPLTFEVVTQGTLGTVAWVDAAMGTFIYTPKTNALGADSFVFKVGNGKAAPQTATVYITVEHVNHAPVATAQALTLNEDVATALTLAATDLDGDSLTYSVVAGPAHGILTGSAPNLTYTPHPLYFGADSFTFKANDGTVDSASASVSITVLHVNHAPVAAAQSVNTNEDVAKAITLAATDLDGDALTYTVVAGPAHGILAGSAPNLTYTPSLHYSGADSFTYKANDGTLNSAVVTVAITVVHVNHAPVGTTQSVSTNEDVAKAITLAGTDIDGDALTYTVVSGPAHGATSGTPPNLTYTPSLHYSGADSFTFKANDGTLNSATVTVSITVVHVNHAPVATAQSVSTNEDVAKTITLAGTDLDGDALTYTVVTSPTHGLITGTAPNLTYTPMSHFFGTDSLVFKANDGTVDSATATVTMNVNFVNHAPVAVNDSVSTQLNVPAVFDVLHNDTDIDGDTLTVDSVTSASHGTVTVYNSGQSVYYTPANGYIGLDSFNYVVKDSHGATVTATVAVGIYMLTFSATSPNRINASTVGGFVFKGACAGISQVNVAMSDSGNAHTLTAPASCVSGSWTTGPMNLAALNDSPGSPQIQASISGALIGGGTSNALTTAFYKDVVVPSVFYSPGPANIDGSNYNIYSLSSTCSKNGDPVTVNFSGPGAVTVSASTTCMNGSWSIGGMDLSSLSDSGTAQGPAPVPTSGVYSGSVQFNGTDALTKTVALSLTDSTVSLWLKTGVPDGGLFQAAGGVLGSAGADRMLYLKRGDVCHRLRNGTVETICSKGKNYADGTWHNVVVAFGGTLGAQQLYIDGILQATGTLSNSDFSGQGNVNIGYAEDSPVHNFIGQMDEVAIWNRALTQSEIVSLANVASGALPDGNGSGGWLDMTGNVLHLHMDESMGISAFADASGSAAYASCTVNPMCMAPTTSNDIAFTVSETDPAGNVSSTFNAMLNKNITIGATPTTTPTPSFAAAQPADIDSSNVTSWGFSFSNAGSNDVVAYVISTTVNPSPIYSGSMSVDWQGNGSLSGIDASAWPTGSLELSLSDNQTGATATATFNNNYVMATPTPSVTSTPTITMTSVPDVDTSGYWSAIGNDPVGNETVYFTITDSLNAPVASFSTSVDWQGNFSVNGINAQSWPGGTLNLTLSGSPSGALGSATIYNPYPGSTPTPTPTASPTGLSLGGISNIDSSNSSAWIVFGTTSNCDSVTVAITDGASSNIANYYVSADCMNGQFSASIDTSMWPGGVNYTATATDTTGGWSSSVTVYKQ